MKIKYYLNFMEDKRMSMDQYGDQLLNYQSKNFKDIEINSFKPKLDLFSKIIFNDKIKMRYARYISYPKQVKNLPKHDIAHICDHNYAHLCSNLNSKLKFITVNDLIPFVFQKYLNKYPYLLKYSFSKLKYFTKVFTISENTKKDLLKFTDCPEEKIEVIMRSVENYFDNSSVDKELLCKKYNLPINKKKILFAAGHFYKNNKMTFKTLEKLITIDKDIVLVLIGSSKNLQEYRHLKENIYQLPFLERKELPNIYKICELLFYPSSYEGFGLPLLESMHCGIPIICSNNSSIPEIVDDCALMCHHDDIDMFVKNTLELLSNKILYSNMVKKSILRAKLFDIQKFHNNLIKTYSHELSKFHQTS